MAEVAQLRGASVNVGSELEAMGALREQLDALQPDQRTTLLATLTALMLDTPTGARTRLSEAVDRGRDALGGLDDAARKRVTAWARGAYTPDAPARGRGRR